MKLKLFHNGRRYWAHRVGPRVNFWSSHKWPFSFSRFDDVFATDRRWRAFLRLVQHKYIDGDK